MKKEYTSPQLEVEELEANGVFTSGADNKTQSGTNWDPFWGSINAGLNI